ncbi:MAG: helicase-related protein, partial [Bacteroidales bacterium]
DALHGDLSQPQRDSVMNRFRSRHLQLLIATDVAARGLDVQDLTHIINYNLPDDPEVYLHRSGRTGRAGKFGICMTITHSREGRRIKEIEKFVGKKFSLGQVPGGKEICEKRLFTLIDRIEKVEVDEALISKFLPYIYKKLEWLDREELIKHFVSVEFNTFLEYYRDARDLNMVADESRGDARGERKRGNKTNYTRLYINVGSKHDLAAANLIGLVNERMRNRNIEIGKIDIQRNFSFFEVDSDFDQQLVKAFEGSTYNNTKLEVQVSVPDKKQSDNFRGGYKGRSKPDDFRSRPKRPRSNKPGSKGDKNKGAPSYMKRNKY